MRQKTLRERTRVEINNLDLTNMVHSTIFILNKLEHCHEKVKKHIINYMTKESQHWPML